MDKKDKKRKYYIYVKKMPIEVDEKVYRAYYQPIWRTFFNTRRNGECCCPDDLVWLCEGICPGCTFYKPWRTLSLDEAMAKASFDEEGLTFENTFGSLSPMPEFITLQRELIDATHTAINQLDDRSREICIQLMNHSMREAAAILGIPRSTLRDQWDDIKEMLKVLLIDNFLD